MANVTNWTILAENKKVFIEAQTRYTRNYAYEKVIIRSQGLKTLGVGEYRWMNRPWQKFEYAQALEDALIEWLGSYHAAEIKEAVNSSSNAQVVLDTLTMDYVIEEQLEESKQPLKESSLQKDSYEISDTESLTWGWEKGYNGGYYYVEKTHLIDRDRALAQADFHRTYATEEQARRAFNRYKNQYKKVEVKENLTEKLIEKYFVENMVSDADENNPKFLEALTNILGPYETYGGYIKQIREFKIRHNFNVFDDGVDAAVGVFFEALIVGDFDDDEVTEDWVSFNFLYDANLNNPIYQAWYNEDGEIESDYTTIYNITVSSEIIKEFIQYNDGENVYYLIEPVEYALYKSVPNPTTTISESLADEGDFDAAYAIFATEMDDAVKHNPDEAREAIKWLYQRKGIKRSRFDFIMKHWDELLDKYNAELTSNNETNIEEAIEQPIRGQATPEYLWQAVCSARPMDFRTIKKYFESPNAKLNRRYPRFGFNHSLIMGAARNNNWEMVDLLKSYGETVTPEEQEEFDYYNKQRNTKNEALEFTPEEKAAKVAAFNEMAEELANTEGYPNKADVENRITEYLVRVKSRELNQADFIYNFIDELMLATGLAETNPDYDTMMDYYLNIVYTNEAFCAEIEKHVATHWLDESKDSMVVPFDKEQSLGADAIRALPKKYGYFMESEMTGIIVAVLGDSKDQLLENEESILKITYADEDTTEVANELKGLGLIQVCSEDDSLVRVEDENFKTHWLANLADGKQYQVEEVFYDSWRF